MVRRQIGEDNDDRFVISLLAFDWSSIQQHPVAIEDLDDIPHALTSDLLRSEPKRLVFPGDRHEGTHRPVAAEILVGSGNERPGPIGNGTKCGAFAVRECACLTDILEFLEEEEFAACAELDPSTRRFSLKRIDPELTGGAISCRRALQSERSPNCPLAGKIGNHCAEFWTMWPWMQSPYS